MQARKARSHGKITTKDVYSSGDDPELSNELKARNSSCLSTRRRSSKELGKRSILSKQNQTAETLEWLSENYELVHGVCVPRCVLYTHYLDFCKKRKFSPAGPATFGKLIRQRFPKLTTRRLGTRGQSKYHYYGISIKESSVYYHSVYSGKGLTRFSAGDGHRKGITKKFCLDKKGSNALPEFPKATEIILDGELSVEKVETFVIMYRTHCQRLLDTVMNANFNEVPKFLLHFWQGMPEHMIPVLECDGVVDIIVVCDSLLYKIFNDVLVPSCIQDIPDSLTEEIQAFAVTFVSSLESCLANTPARLKSQKLIVAKNFVRLLKRNMTFINLAQTARPVFLSYESMSGILNEFRSIDLKKILSELLFLTEQKHVDVPLLLMFLEEFENLLVKQAPIEAYAECFDNIVEEYVLRTKRVDDSDDLSRRSELFLTSWSFVTSRILQELTLKGAPTFGSFQLIVMMFEEYILLIIENQMIAELDEDLKRGLTQHLKNSGGREESAIQDASRMHEKHPGQFQQPSDWNKPDQHHAELQAHSENPHQSSNVNVPQQPKEQQKLFYQNIPQNFESFDMLQATNSQRQDQYDIHKRSFYHFARPGVSSQEQGPHPPNTEKNIPTGEAYLGMYAVPTEISRRGTQMQLYNPVEVENNAENFAVAAIGQNPFENSGQGNSYGSVYQAQVIGQPGQGQGQYKGQYEGQSAYQGQMQQQGSQRARHVLYQGYVPSIGEGQSSNHRYLQSQGHQDQVQYQYESQVQNSSQDNSRPFDQNMNYGVASSNCGSYMYQENISAVRHTTQSNNFTYTTPSINTYQGKTTLPSFYQLSSQLTSNLGVPTGY